MNRILFAVATLGVFAGAANAANPVVVMETSMGTIKIELFADKAPVTVTNFIKYVDDKHFDGTIFHRVIGKENADKDFMIQGGGFSVERKEKPTREAIKNEAGNGLSNEKYTLAMARTNDPDSATAQFFINVTDNKFLDRAGRNAGYAVFGKVIEGMDVVDKIKAVKTGSKKFIVRGGEEASFPNAPIEEVIIKSVRRVP
jgi:cyclophilin family peptidyl-prolyl cis-trans isomerase